MTATATVAVTCGNILGKSVTWSSREQVLYWVDIRAPALHRLDPKLGVHDSWPMPELCGGVVLAESGVVVALRRHIAWFNPASLLLERFLEIEPEDLDNRLNDAKCDRRGRLWVGSMRDFAAATTGSLYAVDPALEVKQMLANVRIPNSLGWSPDNKYMYFADTGEGVVRRYSYDLASGIIDNSVVHIGSDVDGRPEGSAVDSEGFVWNARYQAGIVVRVDPKGRVVATIQLPASQPTSCALGGPELRTLYITTAKQKLSDEELGRQPTAGHLFSVEVEVAGLPDTEFRLARAL